MRKKVVGSIITMMFFCFLLIGCGVSYSENNENIQFVKQGYPESYPNKTYGEAFDSFFERPQWKYFVSEDDEDIVEFTGKCLYLEEEVDVCIQFTLDKKAGTFDINYLSFNEVAQNRLMVWAVISAAFEE